MLVIENLELVLVDFHGGDGEVVLRDVFDFHGGDGEVVLRDDPVSGGLLSPASSVDETALNGCLSAPRASVGDLGVYGSLNFARTKSTHFSSSFHAG